MKERLPITSFMYGLMYLNHQKASIKISPLICKGTVPRQAFGSSCNSWKDLGMPSGYYPVENRAHEKSM